MVVESCRSPAYTAFHDSQRALLKSMQRGRQPSFVATMNAAPADSTQRARKKRQSMLPDRKAVNDQGLQFAGTFTLRLRVAITVTFACFEQSVVTG